MHCIFGACVKNVCGDGVAAFGEQCDDGNERGRDGCSDRCTLERCGNGIVDPGESCDEGAANGKGSCSEACAWASRDGEDSSEGNAGAGGQRDAGEDQANTDAGNTESDDSGAAPTGAAASSDASAPDSGPGNGDGGPREHTDPRSAECVACVEDQAFCRDYQGQGVDLVTACYQNDDPVFAQRCADAYFCSLAATDQCAHDETVGPVTCYCGVGRLLEDCKLPPSPTTGPVGACVPEWEAATGCASGDNDCVLDRFVELTRPAGPARWLIACTLSAVECGPACTP